MNKTITRDQIRKMYEEAKAKVAKDKSKNKGGKDKDGEESIPTAEFKVVAKSADGPKIIVAPGLKIAHKSSGLVYTITDVEIRSGQPVVMAQAGDGAEIIIRPSNFKNYARI